MFDPFDTYSASERARHDGWATERHDDLAELHERLKAQGWRIATTPEGWRALPPERRS